MAYGPMMHKIILTYNNIMDNKDCIICVIIALVSALSGAFIQNLIDKCRLENLERQNQKFKEMIENKMKDFKNQINLNNINNV